MFMVRLASRKFLRSSSLLGNSVARSRGYWRRNNHSWNRGSFESRAIKLIRRGRSLKGQSSSSQRSHSLLSFQESSLSSSFILGKQKGRNNRQRTRSRDRGYHRGSRSG